jgi:hypothetical protein
MSSAFRGPSFDDVIAIAERMAGNPADSVTLAQQLATMVGNLPPPAGELLSRPAFERASLWTLGCTFENIEIDSSPPPQVIQAQDDVWIRGVSAQAYPLFVPDGAADLEAQIAYYRAMSDVAGQNGRLCFDANWRIDGKQGFISGGASEILGPGSVITGDGFWSAPLDWRLQKAQTIEVRVQSRMQDVFPSSLASPFSSANQVIRYLVVAFWAETLNMPSVMGT